MSTITTFGEVDTRSLEQLKRCMEAGDAAFGVLCADHHPGYSQPIGGGIAYEGYVSPSRRAGHVQGLRAARAALSRFLCPCVRLQPDAGPLRTGATAARRHPSRPPARQEATAA